MRDRRASTTCCEPRQTSQQRPSATFSGHLSRFPGEAPYQARLSLSFLVLPSSTSQLSLSPCAEMRPHGLRGSDLQGRLAGHTYRSKSYTDLLDQLRSSANLRAGMHASERFLCHFYKPPTLSCHTPSTPGRESSW